MFQRAIDNRGRGITLIVRRGKDARLQCGQVPDLIDRRVHGNGREQCVDEHASAGQKDVSRPPAFISPHRTPRRLA